MKGLHDQAGVRSAQTFRAGSSSPSGTSAVKIPEYLGSELCLNVDFQVLSPNCCKNIGEAPKLCPIRRNASRADKRAACAIFCLCNRVRGLAWERLARWVGKTFQNSRAVIGGNGRYVVFRVHARILLAVAVLGVSLRGISGLPEAQTRLLVTGASTKLFDSRQQSLGKDVRSKICSCQNACTWQ